MKKIISLVILTTFFFSCQKDTSVVNDSYTSNQPSKPILKEPVVHPVVCEQWKIGEFILNGKDIASHYYGFTFSFCSSNTVYAAGDKTTVAGTWYYDNSTLPPTYSITFDIPIEIGPNDPGVELLNEVWQVLEITPVSMKLNISDAKMNKEVYFKKL